MKKNHVFHGVLLVLFIFCSTQLVQTLESIVLENGMDLTESTYSTNLIVPTLDYNDQEIVQTTEYNYTGISQKAKYSLILAIALIISIPIVLYVVITKILVNISRRQR